MALKLNSANGSVTLTPEDGSGNADVTVPRDGIGTVSNLSDLSVTATATELNILDGATLTTAELNYVDGVTSSIQTQLDAKGTVSSLSDLSITATATELNYVDGVTSAIQTQLDAKGTVSSLSDLSITATATELNTLDGITATVSELNYVDGVTSNIQTQLDQKAETLADLSVTSTAAELNILDGATLTTAELNYVDGVTSAIQTQIDTKAPTASPTFTGSITGANLTLSGDLTVNGTTTTVNSTNTVVSDGLLELGNDTTGTPANDTGIVIERGDSDNAFIGFDESADKFIVGTGTFTGASTGNLTVSTGTLVANVEGNVTGNVTGNADTATALATGRTISLTGDVTGTSASFDGSGNVSITATIADDSHNHVISNVDGLQTALDAKADLSGDTFTGNIGFNDNVKAQFGASNDLEIYCDGSNSVIQDTSAGAMIIKGSSLSLQNQGGTQYYLQANDGSFTKLYHNGAEKLATTSTGIDVTGTIQTDAIHMDDNAEIRMGTSDDFYMFHNGSHTYLQDRGTGDLRVQGDNLHLRSYSTDEAYLYAQLNGEVRLYHNGASKFATTATGADLTGTLTTDGVTVDGTLDIEEVFEKVSTATSTTGTFNFNAIGQGVLYFTANQTANRTINFSNVNSNLAVGQSVTCTALMTQGSTAYYLNAYQVDGTAVTPKWSGGSAPTGGNASGIDVYTFTIIKTASATFTVLASVTQYA
jgi:hypothetical protein